MQEARQLLISKNYDEAFTKYNQLLSENIDNNNKSICALNCAICLINKQNYEQAMEFIEKSITYNPKYIKAYYRKAQVLIQMKQYEEALQIIQNLDPCQEVNELKELIKLQFSDPMYVINDLKSCATEKDAIKFFNELYSKQDYINYDKLMKENGFCQQILTQKFVFQQMKYIQYCFIKSHMQYLPKWLQEYLLANFEFYCKSEQASKVYELINIYCSLFSHFQVNQQVLDLIIENQYFFLEKYLKCTVQLFVQNQNPVVSVEFIEKVAYKAKKAEDFDTNTEMYYLIVDLIILLTKPKLIHFGFLKRDTFRYQDLLILIGIISNSQLESIRKTYTNLAIKLLNTIEKKLNKLRYINLINQILMMTLNNFEFNQEINDNSVKLSETLLDYIQEYRKSKQFNQNIKKFCLLFLLQSKGKYLQLYEYIHKADCEILLEHIFEDHNIEIDESIVLLQFITQFDDIKIMIMQKREQLKKIYNNINNQFKLEGKTSLQKLRQYQILVGYFNILLQLTTDRSAETKEEQKQRFQINDEQYEQNRQFAKQYQQDISEKYFTYTNEYIMKEQIVKFIALEMRTIQLLSSFIFQYQDILNNENVVSKLLTQFSSEDQVHQYLFDKQCLKLVSKSILSKNEFGIPYLCKQMRNANPELFDFKEAQLICDALFVCSQNATHELLTFYALLGIVQLTSLGDFIVDRIMDQKQYIQIQNFLMDENNYIVHASLEIFNNISLNEKFLVLLEDSKLPTFLQLVQALTKQFYENIEGKPGQNEKDFSHPKQILQTLLGLISIISQVLIVQDYFKKELPLIVDRQFYNRVLPYSNENQIKKIKIVWEEYGYKHH
ncbi:unnamed protein product (macronuclear) [Paramecium tetraurelia]|uniref:Uncharacterized protein n=1 Tax=Paramecium tetraurelia TaxID=5888 RepID=A0C6Y4_PARTE|nr:uncharacterized protein GSPATT00035680001 [Paramecium tetraurelia]CAK66551.1 unnamed protein product [Paramecium tetraurelia]|eukprot:XP_001433948.1 hypothetical protein (macronuclear) [Paramecium tetraurelia strain d4-2]